MSFKCFSNNILIINIEQILRNLINRISGQLLKLKGIFLAPSHQPLKISW